MDQNIPTISIIIPVYNVEDYLPRCLDSIKAQTITEWECILIDDGSIDRSGKICDDYAKKDTRFIVIHKNNEGVSNARNVGLKLAKGKWINFVDADDWIENNTYEKTIKLANENNLDLIQWNMQAFSDNGEFKIEKTRTEGIFDISMLSSYFESSMCVKLCKRELLQNIYFPTGIKLSEDRLFSLQVYLICKRWLYTDEIFYHYYMRSTSASHSMTKDMILQETKVIKEMENLCNSSYLHLENFIYEQKKQAKLHAVSALEKADFNLCKETFPEIDKRVLKERSKFSFLYFFIVYHLNIISRLIIYIWKKQQKRRSLLK